MGNADIVLPAKTVESARERFLRKGGNRISGVSFDNFLKRFSETESIGKIAKDIGTSRQAVQQTYNKYFKEIFNGQSYRERRSEHYQDLLQDKTRDHEEEVLSNDVIRHVVGQAREAGYSVSGVESGVIGKVLKRHVLIDGKRCLIYISKTAFRPSPQLFKVSVSLGALSLVDAIVFYADVPGFPSRTFVVPIKAFNEAYAGAISRNKSGVFLVYLPLKKCKYRTGSKAHLDYWKYEDAWHLLGSG